MGEDQTDNSQKKKEKGISTLLTTKKMNLKQDISSHIFVSLWPHSTCGSIASFFFLC